MVTPKKVKVRATVGINELSERRKFPSPIEHQALAFARNAHRVLPLFGIVNGNCECGAKDCGHPGKHPRITGGIRNASSDVNVVQAWCDRWPSMNLGFATGGERGVFVLDVDGPAGRKSLQRLKSEQGNLPLTLRVRTGRGVHLYFHTTQPIKNSAGTKLGEGLDVRGENGYAVSGFSRHISAAVYRAVNPKAKIARAPSWLVHLLVGNKSTDQSATVERSSPSTGEVRAWAEAALKAELDRMRAATQGSRNSTLNNCAFKLGQLVGGGMLPEHEVVDQLSQCAHLSGLDGDEIGPTLESGLRAGIRRPRKFEGHDNTQTVGDAKDRPKEDVFAAELAQLGQTDADLALRFAKRSKDRVIYTAGRGFLAFDGRIWRSDGERQRYIFAEEVARAIANEVAFITEPAEKAARSHFSEQTLSRGGLERMLELAKAHVVVADKAIDAEPWLLNVQNGTLDLRTGVLREHKASDHLTKMAPVGFDEKAACPRFEAFLRHALRNDEELITFVRKAVGLTLTGDARHHVFFFVYGPGRTGKSTFVNIVRELIGDYGVHTPTDTLLSKQYDNNIPADLARMVGARMVTAIEANWDRHIDEARIKAMTGGEPITARFMRQDFFEFQPEFKLWFVANDYPRVRGTAGAFWERVRVIPFNVEVPDDERDLNLVAKLRGEASGIFNWAIKGCLDYQANGLAEPASVKRASSKWQKNADHVRKFADENLIQEDGHLLPAGHLHSFYKSWCRSHGETPLSTAALKQQLEAYDLVHDRTNTGSVWINVKFRNL